MVLDAPIQARLVFFELNDQMGVCRRRRLERFFGSAAFAGLKTSCSRTLLSKLTRKSPLLSCLSGSKTSLNGLPLW
jgi:hypothetical protein